MADALNQGTTETEPYIPPWDACHMWANEGLELSALQRFVLDNEPQGDDQAEEWRGQLRAVLIEERKAAP